MISLAALQPPPSLSSPMTLSAVGLGSAQGIIEGGVDQLHILLSDDPSFIAAVKQRDVAQAARVASQLCKRHLQTIIPRIKSQLAGVHQLPALSSRRPQAELEGMAEALTPREMRPGDWVVIRNNSKATDVELLGAEGSVVSVEAGGWLELHLPKLGRSVRIQQRFVALAPQPPTPAGPSGTIPFSSLPRQQRAAAGHADLLPGAPGSAANAGGGSHGGTGGMELLGGGGDGGRRGAKRSRSEGGGGELRPALSLEQLLPARVPPFLGRSLAKARDVMRSLRRDMLVLEELVPWHSVSPAWRTQRPVWRKATKVLAEGSAARPIELLVPLAASSMQELHEAVQTDKSRGLFARRGAWEARLAELAAGGNNVMCLHQLWEEMREGVRVFLGNHVIPMRAPSNASQMLHSMGMGMGSMSHAPVAGAAERAAQAAAARAFMALDEAASRGEALMSQVPLEHILMRGGAGASGPRTLEALRSMLQREKACVAARMDALRAHAAAQARGHAEGMADALPGLSDEGWDSLMAVHQQGETPFVDYASLRRSLSSYLLSDSMRKDLSAVCMLESEVDTDADIGDEATDMDDSG